MSQPLLSIIIPAWNTGDSVRQIVNSVISQSFTDFEMIIIDDGSTDDTPRILQAIEKTDERIRVFTKENGGPSSARNLGLDKATGKYIQFYDADDNIASDALANTISSMESLKCDLLISGWQIDLQSPKGLITNYKQIAPNEEKVTSNITEYVLRSMGNDGKLYNLWNKLFNADIIRKHHLRFQESLWFGEDVLFSLEYLKYTRSLCVIPDVTYHYLTNNSTSVFSSSSINPEYRIANDEAIVRFAGDNPTEAEHNFLQWLRWRWLMSYWSLVAGSNKKLSNKLQPINAFNPPGLVLARAKHIGSKNYLIQLIAMVARTTALGSLLLGWSINLIKKTIIFIKTTIQR